MDANEHPAQPAGDCTNDEVSMDQDLLYETSADGVDTFYSKWINAIYCLSIANMRQPINELVGTSGHAVFSQWIKPMSEAGGSLKGDG